MVTMIKKPVKATFKKNTAENKKPAKLRAGGEGIEKVYREALSALDKNSLKETAALVHPFRSHKNAQLYVLAGQLSKYHTIPAHKLLLLILAMKTDGEYAEAHDERFEEGTIDWLGILEERYRKVFNETIKL